MEVRAEPAAARRRGPASLTGDILRSESTANPARRVLPAFLLVAAAAAAVSLAGCGTARPSAVTAAAAAKTVPCPQVAQYSPELRDKAAQELDLLPIGSAIEVLLS